MARKFEGKALAAVISLLTVWGITMTQKILGAKGRDKLAQHRPKRYFPKAISVCLPTLATIASDAGLEFKRGRPNPIEGKAQEKYVAALVRDYGSLKAVDILAGHERDKRLFPKPVTVSHMTLQKIAKRHLKEGTLHRGRRPLKAAA